MQTIGLHFKVRLYYLVLDLDEIAPSRYESIMFRRFFSIAYREISSEISDVNRVTEILRLETRSRLRNAFF